MPQMKICPDCRAPNPESRAECYACGQSLAKRVSALPGERTYPCINCDAEIAFSAKTCPGCGRVIAAPGTTSGLPQAVTAASQAIQPSHWKIEPLPDGTIRLTRSGVGHLLSNLGELDTGVSSFAGFAVISLLVGLMRLLTTNPAAFYLMRYAVGGAVLLILLLLTTATHREIRVGANLLERRNRFLGWQQVKRLTMGQFRIASRSFHTRSGLHTETRLTAENLGQHIHLDSEQHRDFSLTGGLFAQPAVLLSSDVRLMGNYLSAITGWQLVDPEAGRF